MLMRLRESSVSNAWKRWDTHAFATERLSSKRGLSQRHYPNCNGKMVLTEIQPSHRRHYDLRILECELCYYQETLMVQKKSLAGIARKSPRRRSPGPTAVSGGLRLFLQAEFNKVPDFIGLSWKSR
jgi:hypothetical protein